MVLHRTPEPPSGHVFLMHQDSLNWILIEGHQVNSPAKLYWNRSSDFWQKKIFKLF